MVWYLHIQPDCLGRAADIDCAVLVQTVAVAVGSMPLSAGFVGVIPALEKLMRPEEGGPLKLTVGQLITWSIGIAFFGVFFAVPCEFDLDIVGF